MPGDFMITRRHILLGPAALALAHRAARAAPGWYADAVVIDGLSGLSDPYAPETDMRLSDQLKAELRKSGTTAINATLLPVGNGPNLWRSLMDSAANYDAVIASNPDFLVQVRRAADISAAKASGRFGLIYGTQDTSMVGTELDRLGVLKSRGFRVIQLTYNLGNLSGDGALAPGNAGITPLGRETIARIEAERMLLDLSHGGATTIAAAIEAATRPMTISHTGCRDLFDHPRNVHDSALKSVADKGGVVGIYFMPFLAKGSKPSGADLISHIEHAWRVAGEDHVGIGTDGDQLPIPITEDTWKRAREAHAYRSKNGFAAPGEGPDVLTLVMDYNSLDRFQRLADDLAARGHGQAKLEKLFGRNLMRLYAEAWGG
jgi:membrane dipeptidase